MNKPDPRLKRAGVSGDGKLYDYKVYVHQKADTGEIFYVGKGRRYRENEKRNRNQHWHNIVKKHGFTACVVASNLSNEEASNFEKILISKLGKENLCNYTDGGEGSEGYTHTEEAKSKMRGRKFTEEHRMKLSEAKKKNPVRYWAGKQRSEELKAKVSQGLKRYYEEKQQSSRSS